MSGAALAAVENKIPNVSNQVKKANYDTKISDIEHKYTNAADYNRFTKDIVTERIKEKGLVDKSAISGFINNTDLNQKVVTLATKAELKAEKNKIIKLEAFDSSYLCGKSHFEDGGAENYLVFQPVYKYFKKIDNTEHISAWKSKGFSDESTKPPVTSNNSLAPSLNYIGVKTRVKFDGSCLKQDKIIFSRETMCTMITLR